MVVGILSFFGVIVFVPVGLTAIIAAVLSLAGIRAARFVGLLTALTTAALADGGFESSNPLTVALTTTRLVGSLVALAGLLVAELSLDTAARRTSPLKLTHHRIRVDLDTGAWARGCRRRVRLRVRRSLRTNRLGMPWLVPARRG